MKYNLDCIRDVLLMLEVCLNITVKESSKTWVFEHNELSIQDVCQAINGSEQKYRPEEIAYSIEKLKEAGFISVIDDEDFPLTLLRIVSITYDGHEFLENIRAPKTLELVKRRAARVGSCALSFVGALAHAVCIEIATGKIAD